MPRYLRRVSHRFVRTHYTISEMLECGHRFESLVLLTDPLTAKWRTCPQCAKQVALPEKKPVQIAQIPRWRRDPAA